MSGIDPNVFSKEAAFKAGHELGYKRADWDAIADEMGAAYAEKTHGPRP